MLLLSITNYPIQLTHDDKDDTYNDVISNNLSFIEVNEDSLVVSSTITNSEEYERKSLDIPSVNTEFKAYMDYRKITDKSSDQWKYRKMSYTDQNGLRKINDDYCVALGTFYASSCGERFKFVLDGGTSFTAIVCDIKNEIHTNSTNQYVPMDNNRGNLIEFIVDIKKLDKNAKYSGDVSSLGLRGNVIKIFKL